jgi:hypothetical protein
MDEYYAVLWYKIGMQIIWSFLNSTFFVALATILTGLTAFILFFRQKGDERKNAAVIILLEIRNAELKAETIREKIDGELITGDLPPILPVNSWKRYIHLFAKDFDQDELGLINDFYARCEIIQEHAERNNNYFWIATEERTKIVQQMHMELIDRTHETLSDLPQLKDSILQRYVNDAFLYVPKKTARVITYHLQDFPRITSTTAGAKLKGIAGL